MKSKLKATSIVNNRAKSPLFRNSSRQSSPKNIDGIVRPNAQNNYSSEATIRPISQATKKERQINSVEKKPLPAKTLMRTAVKKPSRTLSLITNITAPINDLEEPSQIKSPIMIGSVDQKLARRATSIIKSDKISRFGATVKEGSEQIPILPSKTTKETPKEVIKKTELDNIFDHAIANSTAHLNLPLTKKEQRAVHGKKPKKLGKITAYLSVTALALAFVGYAIYSNIPNMMAKVASLRAGFSANVPSYKPVGYSLEAVGYQPGMVSFNFKNNTLSRSFSLTERASSWDSQTLVSSVVVPTDGHNYKKIMIGGQTLYLYGSDQAAWVSNNIWYQLQGNGSLSTNQLINLASTL